MQQQQELAPYRVTNEWFCEQIKKDIPNDVVRHILEYAGYGCRNGLYISRFIAPKMNIAPLIEKRIKNLKMYPPHNISIVSCYVSTEWRGKHNLDKFIKIVYMGESNDNSELFCSGTSVYDGREYECHSIDMMRLNKKENSFGDMRVHYTLANLICDARFHLNYYLEDDTETVEEEIEDNEEEL